MKRLFSSLAIAIIFLLTSPNSNAQAWEKSTKVLSLGVGGSQFFHIYPNNDYYRGWNRWRTPFTGQLNFQGEFGVHDYVGIGFTTGFGGSAGYYWGGRYGYGYTGEVNFPIGLLANFHFYQLISDKTGKNIHADKLDIYAGINLGSGVAAQFYSDGGRVIPIAFGGVQAGIRYYFAPKVGVNAEVGWGKSVVNAGMVFKL